MNILSMTLFSIALFVVSLGAISIYTGVTGLLVLIEYSWLGSIISASTLSVIGLHDPLSHYGQKKEFVGVAILINAVFWALTRLIA